MKKMLFLFLLATLSILNIKPILGDFVVLQINSTANQVAWKITEQDLAKPFTTIKKIEDFCLSYHDILVTILRNNGESLSCVGYVFNRLHFKIERNNVQDQSALDGFSLAYFYFINGLRQGLTKNGNDPTAPVLYNPLEVFVWRTSLALLLPYPCGLDNHLVFNHILSLLKNITDDETQNWLDLYLIIGIDKSCFEMELFVRYFEASAITYVLVELSNPMLLTETFDYLARVAYDLGCQFFMTIHHNTVFLRSHVLWTGISKLIGSSYLPNSQRFGLVFYLSESIQNYGYSLALYSRTHVELFILSPQQSTSMFSSSWSALEEKGFNMKACLCFYCEIYMKVKNSCYLFTDYLAFNPNLPTPSSSLRSSNINLETLHDIPILIFHHRLRIASWYSSSSPYHFVYSTRSMVYTEGAFMNYLETNQEDIRENYQYSEPSPDPHPSARVAFITAIFGGYEASLQPFVRQSIPSDFICFTDLPESILANGWIIDRTPYHKIIPLPYDSSDNINSLSRNHHPMNIAKFYKAAFQLIPRLQHYDVIIWLDGNVVITNASVAESVLGLSESGESLTIFEHWRFGSLFAEAQVSSVYHKYSSTNFAGYSQPRQDTLQQYESYLQLGYDEGLWNRIRPSRPQYGLWVTCFIGFNMKDPRTPRFLTMWHEQILRYTTQDQVSFSFVVQSVGLYPYSLPNNDVNGNIDYNNWFWKTSHAK